MNPSRPFILRPIATSLLMAAILLIGIIAFEQLPIAALPEVDYPTMQVLTFYPGASPDVVASAVTAPLERQLGEVPGLNQMLSTSSEGVSVITLQFALSLNIDIAEQDVQEAINAAQNFLPANLPMPPIYNKVNPADAPILTLALSSDSIPLSKVEDYTDTRLAEKISQLPGVGAVTISGGQKPAVRIQVNPTQLASYGLNLEDVHTALSAASLDAAKGSFDGPHQSYQIAANDQITTSSDYRQLVLAYRNGSPVMLKDVAKVVDGIENNQQSAWMNRTPAVIVNIQRQPGANIIDVVDRIQALLPKLRATIPPAINISVLTDRTTTVRASVADVEFELMLCIALVVAVIFVFLRTFAATIIPSIAVPLSLVGTFGAMYALGFSLNNLTLMALTISTGFVVDDAIVMIENITRYVEEGEEPLAAALKGAEQIGFTIMALTVSLIAVLIPLLLMGDITGRLFREFAVTLSVTILISAVVSLTLTPMLCAKLLKHKPASEQGRFYRISERMFEQTIAFYGRTLDWVLRHRTLTLVVAAGTLVVTVLLYVIVPKGFFPVQDTGEIQGVSEADQSVSFAEMARLQQQLTAVILKDPAVESLSSFIGVDGTNTTLNSGRIQINLKSLKDRSLNASGVIRRLQGKLAKVEGISLYMQPVQDISVEDIVSRTEYQYSLQDPSAEELSDYATKFTNRLKQLPELADVASDLQTQGRQAALTFDRPTASRLGITPQNIDDSLYDSFGQRQVSTVFTQLNQYHIILEVSPEFQTEPDDLQDIYLKSASGGAVPLSAVTKTSEITAPILISHMGQFPATTLSFNLNPQASLGAAITAIKKVEKDLPPPPAMAGSFQGTAAAFVNSLTSEPILILSALVTVYIVLGVLYESYIHPITILSTLPSAGVGAILALLICRTELTVVAIIGIVLLIGIVQKNAIMMIDFALAAERQEKKAPLEAIHQACLLRFRPILMTTMAAMLGAVPLAFGHGVGSELRRPLGITIIGGLIFSQLLTLYTTPVIYLFFDEISAKLEARGRRKSEAKAAAAGAVPETPAMSLSSPFIQRPIATTLLTAAVALAGVVAFPFLPVSPLPQVDFPTILVSAQLPGASPEIMASSVATPLERAFGRIAGVTEMTAQSTLGQTQVTLQFDLSRSIDAAARDVESAINAARSFLPSDLPTNPTYRKINPADSPIMGFALTSPSLAPSALYDAASTILEQKLSQIQGVGQVNVGGSSSPAVRIDLNPTQLNGYGLQLEDVRKAVAAATANEAKGSFSSATQHWMITANDQLMKAADYRSLIVSYRNGAPVRLSDVAQVSDSVQTVRSLGLANGQHAALIFIFRQPGANIIDTVDAIKAALPKLHAAINPSIKLTIALDQTLTIRASVKNVELSLGISITLVVLVVFVFLREIRATVIPIVAVPVSIIGTLGVMYLAGYSVDNLSLMALTISTGFVVDDAIVVLENITRHREGGLSAMDAAFKGSAEIGSTVVSMSISLVAVFTPILLMGGIIGRLFREFAVVLSTTILVSLMISLTATPMMCSRLPPNPKSHGKLYLASERGFQGILAVYKRSLGWVLDHSILVLVLAIVTLALNIFLYIVVPKDFFPQQDTGRLNANIIADQDTSFQSMQHKIQRLAAIVQQDPGVDFVLAFTGGGGGTTTNTGRGFIALKPLGRGKGQRTASAAQIMSRLRPKLAVVPGATLVLQARQDVSIGGRQSAAQYQYTIQSDNLDELNHWGPIVLKTMRGLRGLTDVTSDAQNSGLSANLVIDRPTASRLGISPAAIDNILYDGFGEREIATTYTPINQYFVVMEVAPEFWQNPGALNNVYVTSASGGVVPLAAFTHFQSSTAPLAVNHSGVFPSVTISFNLVPGVALGDAVTLIVAAERNIGMPTTITGSFGGTAQAFNASLANEPLLILAAILAVYIVLGVLYESYIHPITILSTLPSAGVGALLALLVTHTSLTVIALVGILLLIGIVKKNAIMMIDFAIAVERRDHKTPKEAVFEACLLRFRPIMMTTMAAMLGGLPLAIGSGMGSELRRPLGITIVGGLAVSQVLTLYTTPVIYLYMDRLNTWIGRFGFSKAPAAPAAAPAPGPALS